MVKVIHSIKSRKNFYPEILSKKFLFKMYATYSTLLYTQKANTQNLSIMRIIIRNFINENLIS